MPKKKKTPKKSKINVTVYSTPTCPYCEMTKDFLKDNKIKFKSIDVSSDYSAAQNMVRKSGQTGVHVIEINKQIIVGFNKSSLKKALKIK